MVPTARTVQHGGPLGTSACHRAWPHPGRHWEQLPMMELVPLRCHTGKKYKS